LIRYLIVVFLARLIVFLAKIIQQIVLHAILLIQLLHI
jgi:hypothetical protein